LYFRANDTCLIWI